MRILIALHDLTQIGGSQTWALAMHNELAKRHDVEVFCAVNGEFGKQFDCEVHAAKLPSNDFDLLLISQNVPMQILAPLNGYKIYTQHGPFHSAEKYPGGADAVVAVSWETQTMLSARGYDSTVIWNGIDLDTFKPDGRDDIEYDVLIACKGKRGTEMAVAACENELTCDVVNYKTAPTHNMAARINAAGGVITYGRGALEALACGRRVFSFDARGSEQPRGDGWIDEEAADHCMAHTGFNGRTPGGIWQVYDSAEQLRRDLVGGGGKPRWLSRPANWYGWQRRWSERSICIKDKAKRYLALIPTGVKHGA